MKELTMQEVEEVAGGFRIKLHFNVFQALFTVVGASIMGGPVGAGIAVATLIGAQGAGNLNDLVNNENQG